MSILWGVGLALWVAASSAAIVGLGLYLWRSTCKHIYRPDTGLDRGWWRVGPDECRLCGKKTGAGQ